MGISASGSDLTEQFEGEVAVPMPNVESDPEALGQLLESSLITSAAFVPFGPNVSVNGDDEVLISTSKGGLTRFSLSSEASSLTIEETARYIHPICRINAMTVQGDRALTVAERMLGGFSTGLISLYDVARPQDPPAQIWIPGQPMCGQLFLDASTPYAVIGTRRTTGRESFLHDGEWTSTGLPAGSSISTAAWEPSLQIYAAAPSAFILDPIRQYKIPIEGGTRARFVPPYCLAKTSPASPFGRSPEVIVSGWYNSYVHIHDLRAPSIDPVLSFHDRWTPSAVYSVGMGGSCGAYVVAGMASLGIIEMYDVRRTTPGGSGDGIGLFAPEREGPTAIYGLHVEGTRVWGVARHLFLLDMARGATGHDWTDLTWLHSAEAR